MCIKHLADFYHLGPLVKVDPIFGQFASRAICMEEVGTPFLKDRIKRHPYAKEIQEEISKTDPPQPTISFPSVLKSHAKKIYKQSGLSQWNIPFG